MQLARSLARMFLFGLQSHRRSQRLAMVQFQRAGRRQEARAIRAMLQGAPRQSGVQAGARRDSVSRASATPRRPHCRPAALDAGSSLVLPQA